MLSQHSVPKHRRQLLPLAHESLAARFSTTLRLHAACHSMVWALHPHTSQTPAPSPQCGSAAQCARAFPAAPTARALRQCSRRLR